MRKTIRSGIDRRAVYKFLCTGGCNRIKSSYVYDRAKSGVCLTCSKKKANSTQDGLFGLSNSEDFEAIEANPFYSDQTKVILKTELLKKNATS